ncbi:MAG: ComEA family DNA-binding protein [Erysipelotrichaceae bacterium]|nr:ComEA family DNA-binding protein [Erysipelotrichaceae bacterium]
MFLFILFCVICQPKIIDYELPSFETEEITVEVKGEVSEPGIIELPAYSTVSDLLEVIELTDEADMDNVNLTTVLKNHDVIVIPAEREGVLSVSINTAGLDELVLIPGIGKTTAQNIIDYRDSNGLFQSVDDLLRVKGIGVKTLEKIREYITL